MKVCSVPTASWTFRVGDGDEIVVAVPADLDDVALALALVGVGVELLKLFHELLMVDAEEHAVDGLELERIVVVVHDLDKCVAGGQREVFLGSLALLLLFIAGLGGGEGVVAVRRRRTAGARRRRRRTCSSSPRRR